jgi:hypothetical protein
MVKMTKTGWSKTLTKTHDKNFHPVLNCIDGTKPLDIKVSFDEQYRRHLSADYSKLWKIAHFQI